MIGTPKRTPVGSGRGGARRSAAKSSVKRLSRLVGRSAVHGISRSSQKKLARRAGVKRIANGCFDPETGILGALVAYLRKMIPDCIIVMEYARRRTVTPNDIAYVLKRHGTTVYKEGMDWTYGFYTKESVRRRVCVVLPPAVLAEAAAERAHQQARTSADATALPPVTEEEEEEAQALPAAAAVAQAEQQQQEAAGRPAAAELPPAASAVRGADQASAAHAPQQQQQTVAGPAAAAALQLLSPVRQMPALERVAATAVGGKGGADLAPPAAAAERRLSLVPTPAIQPLSKERAAEIQAWMSDIMHGPLCREGRVSRRELKTVMLARHGCDAGEVMDVLFGLERQGSVMQEEGWVYVC